MDQQPNQLEQPEQIQYQAPMSDPKYFLNKKFAITFVVILLLGGGAAYGIWWWGNQQAAQEVVAPTFTPRPSVGVACTQEAKQCPDGSYVSRTGLNCEFAACPGAGLLTGHVTIGPNCPVERVGVPCLVPPETYSSREFLVFTSSQKEVARFHANSKGDYNISLPPGTYTIVSAKTGMGFLSKNLPSAVIIKAGQTTTLNFSIDTGIR